MEKKKETSVKPKFTKKALIIALAAVVGVIALFCAYSAYLLTTYGGGSADTVSKGITIDGVDVGGMSVQKATEILNENKAALSGNTVELVMDDSHTVATFDEFEINYSTEETVTLAAEYGKKGNLFSRIFNCFKLSTGNVNFETQPEADADLVYDYVLAYAQAMGNTVVENSYVIENDKLVLTEGKSGTGIDKELVASEITDILKSGESGKIGVNLVSLDPAPWDVDAIYEDVCSGPSDAGYEVVDGKGFIVEAKKGYKFNKADLEALLKTSPVNGVYTLDLEVTEPGNSKLDETGLFPEVISQYKSSLAGSAASRRTNVTLACKSVNGTILNPGDIFSYNKVVGAVTAANGYLPATIFTSKGHESGIGGGICQVSSTLYCAALEGNLEIVKRRNHMYIVGYVPYGQDATVYEGELDFRFKNNTNEPMKITAEVVNGEVVVKFLGKKPDPDIKVEIENIIISRISPGTTVREDPTLEAGTVVVEEKGTIGLVVDTYKKVYKKGELLSRDYLHRSSYKPINRVEVHGTMGAEETPAEGTAPAEDTSPAEGTTAPAEGTTPASGTPEQPSETTSTPTENVPAEVTPSTETPVTAEDSSNRNITSDTGL